MTVFEWVRFSVLIVAIVLSIALSIIVLIKSRSEGFTRKNVAYYVLALGFLFIIYLAYNIKEIRPAEGLQVMLMLGLVAVTGAYALFTARQANASVKMAEEMRNARYDAVRPVIDFKLRESYPMTIQEGLTIKEREEADLASGLRCILHNIGIGPATDVYSFTPSVGGERRRIYLGSLVKGATTEETILPTEQRGGCWFLVAHYRDVYDRWFESSREVHLDVETGKPLLGPLKISPLPKKELNQND